jgi:asparagine synthase (glutamine-hydrolysing)
MCGIAGVVGARASDLAPVVAMTAALRHRGPDDEGYFLADTRNGRHWAFRGRDTAPAVSHPPLPAAFRDGVDLALGHRRLAIVDLSPGGHGPMASPDGSTWITYNGEVYNHVELKEELKGKGHRFRTTSDTEVLLASYAEWGPDALHRWNGMWAFALYDARRRVLFCARDRFGVKPFHYYHDEGSLFAFASEIKGLLAHPRVPRRPHEPSLAAFLVRGDVDQSDQTFFAGVSSLPPGHRLSLDLRSRKLTVERWYALPAPEPRPGDPAELRGLLEDAVRLRLRSDVDVGSCLSGGLDSSSIVALTASLRGASPNGRHRSFSVVYDDPGLREEPYVTDVVAATGVEGVRTTPTAAELLRDLPSLVRHQDEPFASLGLYSQWRVMALARKEGVKVLLDGQGADEVLAGYHYHYGPYLAEVAGTQGLGRALREAARSHVATGRPLWFFLGLIAYHALPLPGAIRDRARSGMATHGLLPRRLLDPALGALVDGGGGERHRPRRSLVEERRAAILKTSLPALLRYEDRSSMAFGIEARTPYLDYRLVERALALPAGDLIRAGWTKSLLREAMAGRLPESVRRRRDKLGFASPEIRWLGEIAAQVRLWLGADARIHRIVTPAALRDWLRRPDAELARQPGLWRLVSAELWLRYLESCHAE